jgi:hypothetical protein
LLKKLAVVAAAAIFVFALSGVPGEASTYREGDHVYTRNPDGSVTKRDTKTGREVTIPKGDSRMQYIPSVVGGTRDGPSGGSGGGSGGGGGRGGGSGGRGGSPGGGGSPTTYREGNIVYTRNPDGSVTKRDTETGRKVTIPPGDPRMQYIPSVVGGTRDSLPGSNRNDGLRQANRSPYSGTEYSGQQNLFITLPDGSSVAVRGDIFADRNNPQDGRMAVPVDRLSPEVREFFDKAGIPTDNGYYLINDARNNPNVQVGWNPMETGVYKWDEQVSGPPPTGVDPNVKAYNVPVWKVTDLDGGGHATIVFLPPSSGGGSGGGGGGGGGGTWRPPDLRFLTASLDPLQQEVGKSVTVEARVSGATENVTAEAPWGQVELEPQGQGVWRGVLDIPYETLQKTYTVTVRADISQPPHYPAETYQVPLKLEVLPPPDKRSLAAELLQPVLGAGSSLVVTAKVNGEADSVRVVTAWGAAVELQRSGDVYQAVVPVPASLSGVLPVKVAASISQPPHYPAKLFERNLTLTVKPAWQPGEELPPMPSDNPDWWTPPWAQQGW